MTIQQLEYVVAVHRHRSFSRAAEACCVTQPTLSMQIRKLEAELGVTLFDRSRKPVRATPVGEAIIRQASANLQGLSRIRELVEEQSTVVRGAVRLGIIPTLAPYLLPRFVTAFLRDYPEVELIVEELLSEEIVRKLKQNLLDVGILVTPLDDGDVTEIPLFYEPFVAYVSTSHPLIHQDFIELKDLNMEEMVLLREGHCFRNQVVRICPELPRKGPAPHLRFESGSLETLKRIIETNYGYTLLPELAVIDLPAEKRHYLKELTQPKPVREVSLAVHRGFPKRRLVEALREAIHEGIPEYLRDDRGGRIVPWV